MNYDTSEILEKKREIILELLTEGSQKRELNSIGIRLFEKLNSSEFGLRSELTFNGSDMSDQEIYDGAIRLMINHIYSKSESILGHRLSAEFDRLNIYNRP